MSSLDEYLERVVHGPPFLPGEEMKYEVVRLGTYKDWPSWTRVNPVALAAVGFCYTGRRDVVFCFACTTEVGEWELGQAPFERHRAVAPSCPMVLGRSSNVPSQHAALHAPPVGAASASPSAAPLREISRRTFTWNGIIPSTESLSSLRSNPSIDSCQVQSESHRLRTFDNRRYACPQELAKNGFYCLGRLDQVQCAFCGGVLGNWRPGDKPEEEHRRHFPLCPFVTGSGVRNVSIEHEAGPVQPPASSVS